jgi:hypothetical protein
MNMYKIGNLVLNRISSDIKAIDFVTHVNINRYIAFRYCYSMMGKFTYQVRTPKSNGIFQYTNIFIEEDDV